MRVVLADPALERERFHRRGAGVGRIFVEGHVLVDLHHQRMQESEHVVLGFRAQLAGERRHRRIDFGQRRRAQEQARRKPLVGASQHAAGVVGFDQAFDSDGEIGDRPAGQHMGDVAERVLMHVEPRIGGDVDLPVGDVLPVMAARRHPQDLDHAGGRRLVAIGGGMGNSQAHGFTGSEFRHSGARPTDPCKRGPMVASPESITAIVRIDSGPAPQVGSGRPKGASRNDGCCSCRRRQIKYCLAMISPSLPLSAMNSWMNSCTPCWKISFMLLCSRRLRTPRAWRCAAPWRP